MPIYVYETIVEEGEQPETFEFLQSIHSPILTQHPRTGQPVRRVISPTKVAGKWSEMGMQKTLSDKNLADKGFTKYVKMGDGHYEKRAGKGPDVLSAGSE